MFDTEAFVILVLASLAATVIAIPRQVRALRNLDLPVPAPPVMMIVQSLILSTLAASFGAVFAGRLGLGILDNGDPARVLIQELVAGIFGAGLSIAGVLVIYYGIFRKQLPAEEVIIGERLRLEMGILARVLYGGVVEEVQFRWGLLSLLAWIGVLVAPGYTSPVFVVAVVVSSVGFALYHIAGLGQLGMGPSRPSIWTSLLVNLWGGLIFGALFLRYGLLAAMIAHALVHIIWISFEGRFLEWYETSARAA